MMYGVYAGAGTSMLILSMVVFKTCYELCCGNKNTDWKDIPETVGHNFLTMNSCTICCIQEQSVIVAQNKWRIQCAFSCCQLVPPEKSQKPGGEGPIYRPIQYPEDIQAALAQVTKTIATPLQKSQTVSFGNINLKGALIFI